MGVLALQGDVREHAGALRAAGAEPVPVRRAEELSGLDGLVLPGGESTAIGRLLDLAGMLGPLRGLLGAGLPVYGSCAGMILLARDVIAAGGRLDQPTLDLLDVTVRRNAFGTQVDSFETDLQLDGVGAVHAVFIRAPWVERVGSGVQVLARVPARPGAGEAAGRVVAVRQGPVLATSFHPELTGDGRVHALFVAMVTQARDGDSAAAC